MTEQARLAVVLRKLQWELDEAAFEVGAGRYSAERQRQLAERLMALAAVLQSARGTVIDIERNS